MVSASLWLVSIVTDYGDQLCYSSIVTALITTRYDGSGALCADYLTVGIGGKYANVPFPCTLYITHRTCP